MVESDSLEVVGAILNPTENRGSYAAIIDNCRLLLEELEKQMRPHICFLDTTLYEKCHTGMDLIGSDQTGLAQPRLANGS
jgi:hypothetical protein